MNPTPSHPRSATYHLPEELQSWQQKLQFDVSHGEAELVDEAVELRTVVHMLSIFSGEQVRTHQLRKGQGAPASERLTLFQARRNANEELAVWRGTQKHHRFKDFSDLLEALTREDDLLEQIIPAQRGVVSMCTSLPYLPDKPEERLLLLTNSARLKQFYLLIRDGKNVFVTFSNEPTHEAAQHLFPKTSHDEPMFDGVDAASLPVELFHLSAANVAPEHDRLHYARMLTLLCGLQSRHRLLGNFHQGSDHTCMLEHEFQRQYFDFVPDAMSKVCPHHAEKQMSVQQWFEGCNSEIREGSRILISAWHQRTQLNHLFKRGFFGEPICQHEEHSIFVVRSGRGFHYIDLPTIEGEITASHRIWLDGPKSRERQWYEFLCLDRVTLPSLSHHLHCRSTRTANSDVLTLLRQAHQLLIQERDAQVAVQEVVLRLGRLTRDSRANNSSAGYKSASVTLGAQQDKDRTKEALSRSTCETPEISMRLRQEEELSVLEVALRHAANLQTQPLMLNRTANDEFALYAVATPGDLERYVTPGAKPFGMHWGWVMRYPASRKRNGKWSFGTASPVWLRSTHPVRSETTVQQWPDLNRFLHVEEPQVDRLSLRKFHKEMLAATEWAACLQAVSKCGRDAIGKDPAHNSTSDNDGPGIPKDWIAALEKASADRLLQRIKGKHYQQPMVFLPIGVERSASTGPAWFIYAFAKVTDVMDHCANKEQKRAYRERMMVLGETFKPTRTPQLFWQLAVRDRPLQLRAGTLPERQHSMREAWWALPNSSTGPKRASRRSFNRAVDTLMGKNPRRRRYVMNLQQQSLRLIKDAPGMDPWKVLISTPEAPRTYSLSPLIWDEDLQRGIGTRYFSTRRG